MELQSFLIMDSDCFFLAFAKEISNYFWTNDLIRTSEIQFIAYM